MNLLLFDDNAIRQILAADDPRVVHIREVLKMGEGDTFDVGAVNGPRGKATIRSDDVNDGMALETAWGELPPESLPIKLIVGLPRPQTARKILQECTSLGVSRIHFFQSEKGEPSYAESKLWTTGEWKRLLVQGAEQAFTTRIPEVEHFDSLGACLERHEQDVRNIALDVYEAGCALSRAEIGPSEICLAVGPERGWSGSERDHLREHGFTLVHLGERVLRTETACIAAVSVLAAKLGNM